MGFAIKIGSKSKSAFGGLISSYFSNFIRPFLNILLQIETFYGLWNGPADLL